MLPASTPVVAFGQRSQCLSRLPALPTSTGVEASNRLNPGRSSTDTVENRGRTAGHCLTGGELNLRPHRGSARSRMEQKAGISPPNTGAPNPIIERVSRAGLATSRRHPSPAQGRMFASPSRSGFGRRTIEERGHSRLRRSKIETKAGVFAPAAGGRPEGLRDAVLRAAGLRAACRLVASLRGAVLCRRRPCRRPPRLCGRSAGPRDAGGLGADRPPAIQAAAAGCAPAPPTTARRT